MKSSLQRTSLIVSVLLVGLSAIPIAIWGMDFDYQTAEIIGYLTMIFSLLLIFFGVRRYRDQELGGLISFGKAFGSGLMISLVAALAFGIYTWILVGYWHPEFTENYYSYMIEQAESSMSSTDFQVYKAKMERNLELFSNSAFQGVVMAATILIIGFIISLISALILKREEGRESMPEGS